VRQAPVERCERAMEGKDLFGCVIFDDPHQHTAGWAAVAGHDATRIRGTQDLSSGVVWITNLEYTLLWEAGLSRSSRLRRDDYLRQKISRLLDSLGLDLEQAPRCAEALAAVFANVMCAVRATVPIDFIPQYTLRSGLREALADPDPLLPVEVADALTDSIEYWTPIERTAAGYGDDDPRYRYFTLPLLAHARNVLSMPLPDGEWVQVASRELPATSSQVVEWVTRWPTPLVVQVSIKDFDPSLNLLINYGGGTPTNRSRRRWVTTVELATLAPLADVRVHTAFTSARAIQLDAPLAQLQRLPDAYEMSLSVGLCAENCWTAMSTSHARGNKTSAKRPCNPYIPFLRAQDRVLCFHAAARLFAEGINVIGYGTGAVIVNAADVPAQELARAARTVGLLPPALGVAPQHDEARDVASPLAAIQALYVQSRRQDILSVDAKIVAGLSSVNTRGAHARQRA